MTDNNLKHIIEAIIFASEEELTLKQLKDILENCRMPASFKEIEQTINSLNEEYETRGSAFSIIRIAGGYQYATKREFAEFVGKLKLETGKKKLSQSAIETLSIIAYKQPIPRSEMEFIRGVNVDYIVNALLERDLIMIKGRASTPGRPILYGTSDNFLKVLGLNSLSDLPKLREINEILKNEKIEGITEADIDLFNSVNNNFEENPAKGQSAIDFNDVPDEKEPEIKNGNLEINEIKTNDGQTNQNQ